MLDFFVCWGDADPIYQEFFPRCKVLLSLAHVPLSWNVARFPEPPGVLLVDSGAYALMQRTPAAAPSQKQIFHRQLRAAAGSKVETILCHLDIPVRPDIRDALDVYRRVELTVANAYEFISLFKNAALPPNFLSMGVIQGHDRDSIGFCAAELKRAGFDRLGIGSLARLYRTDLILERVEAAVSVVGADLHVFGVSGLATARALSGLGIRSLDSSRPIRAAMHHCLLYSRPLRMYKIAGVRLNRNMPIIREPLPCDCPVCRKDPGLLMKPGRKKYHNYRALHNYYHLRLELESV